MHLIVGLGNPGKKYQDTPHNAGFAALDLFAEQQGCGEWRLDKKSNALLAGCVTPGVTQPVLLAKPQTFMNNSGKAVASLAKPSFKKLGLAKDLIVVHDDIDLPAGTVRVGRARGSAGHKGVDSIIQSLGTKDFDRIRIGIQPSKGKPQDVERFVLKRPAPELRTAISGGIRQAAEELQGMFETTSRNAEA